MGAQPTPSAGPLPSHPNAAFIHQLSSSDAFDVSNYDPLQAHAFHLSAAAGYAPPIAETTIAQPSAAAVNQPRQPQLYYFSTQQPGVQGTNATTNAVQLDGRHQSFGATAGPLTPGAPAVQGPISTQAQQFYTTAPQIQPNTSGHTAALNVGPAQNATISPQANFSGKRPLDMEQSMPSSKRQQVAFQVAPSMVKQEAAPLNVPSSTGSLDEEIDPMNREPPPNFETMSAEEKRRYERNVREQQRSFKISQQIKELRIVLVQSNIPFKPNKFSILLSVVDYIKQLQGRAIMLDAEHRKLIDTMRQTSEMVNSGQNPSEDDSRDNSAASIGNDADVLFVQGVDYKAVFQQCSGALGVAALDGRILACNDEFATVSGFTREELLRQSVFNLMQNHEDVFRAMGEMLSSSDSIAQPTANKDDQPTPMYWSGVVNQKNQNLYMNISLTRSKDGLPKFFNCALTAT